VLRGREIRLADAEVYYLTTAAVDESLVNCALVETGNADADIAL
jgi:hypothetical protein